MERMNEENTTTYLRAGCRVFFTCSNSTKYSTARFRVSPHVEATRVVLLELRKPHNYAAILQNYGKKHDLG